MRLLLARGRAERGRVDDADPLGEDAEAALAEQLAGVVLDLLEVLRALDEDVGDGEGVVEGQRGVVAAGADLLGPDLARDVEQQAAAVPLAVDVAGAVDAARGAFAAGLGMEAWGAPRFDAELVRNRHGPSRPMDHGMEV